MHATVDLPAGQHVVFAGFPEMGHLIPMLSLAQNLVDRGCRITYVTATSTADEMLKLWPIKRTDPDASGRASRLRLVGIGSPVSHQGRTATEFIWKNIVMLSKHFQATLDDLLGGLPMTDTATGIRSVWSSPTAAICTTLSTVPTENCLAAGLKTLVELDFPVHALTEFSRFKHEDLTKEEWRQSGKASTSYPVLLDNYLDALTPDDQIPVEPRYGRQLRAGITWSLRNIPKCHGLLVNSAEVVEGTEIAFVRRLWGDRVPVVPVGPLLAKDAFDPFRGTLQPEVLDLLSACTDGEALYISFGSFISPNKDHLRMVAQALAERRQPFVWSLRDYSLLDEGYEEAVRGFGVFVPWVDQRALLAHPSIGFFVSHMGWNSMLESLTAGKPLIGWPLAFDQLCNSRRIVEKYRMGFRFPPSLFFHRRAPGPQLLAGVRATLELALDTPEGHDTKLRAAEMGRKLRETLKEGGEASKAKDWVVDYLQKPIAPKGSRAAAYGLKKSPSPFKASFPPISFTALVDGLQDCPPASPRFITAHN